MQVCYGPWTSTIGRRVAPGCHGRKHLRSDMGNGRKARLSPAIPIQSIFIAEPCFCTSFRCRQSAGCNNLEMNAVKKLQTLGMSAVVATAAFALFTLTANAQQPPAAAPAPAAAKPAAPPAAAKAPAAAPAAAAAPKKVVASVCKGLDEAGCKAKPECSYVVPTAVNATTGKVPAAYCRKTAGVAVKKPAAAAAPAVKPAAPATAAAVKPAAPAAPKQ